VTIISAYAVNNSPSSQFALLGTDPGNDSMGPTGTTELVPVSALPLPVTGVYNVVTLFGADPTGTTDSTAAIQSAITAAAASANGYGVVYLPAGTYVISGGWVLPVNVMFAGVGNVGSSVSGVFGGTVLKLSAEFSGAYVFSISDVDHDTVNGATIQGVLINGSGYTATAVNGINITGPAMTQLLYVNIVEMSGWGIYTTLDLDAGEIGPYGQNWDTISVDSCNYGINLIYAEDSTFSNVYVIGINEGAGWQICGVDNSHFIGCRAEWCATYGFWITNTTVGGTTYDWTYATGFCEFVGCSTDRNTYDGVHIDATWTTGQGAGTGPGAVMFSGLVNRRDGAANNEATGTYAGVALDGTTLPVVITGLGQMVGGPDGGGAGNFSPRYGIYATGLGDVNVQVTGGIAWGYSAGISGTAANFIVTGVQQITGTNYNYTY
jgi:hypothetical protein